MKNAFQKKYAQKTFIGIILTLFLIAGGILRFYELGGQSYWMDEGYTVNAILSILEHGTPTLDSGETYFCPLYCYPTAFLVRTFDDDPASFRLLAVISGILFIAMMYAITAQFFTKHIALLSSFFITFSYWQIAWSRQARWYTLFTFFFWLALFFFYQSLYHKERRFLWIILTLLFTGLAILTHGLGYLLPFIFLGWIAIDQIFFEKKFRTKTFGILALGAFGAVLVLDKVFSLNFIAPLLESLSLHYELPYYLSFYLRTYWLFIPFVLIAVFALKSNKNKKETSPTRATRFLLFAFVAYLIPLSFLTPIVHYRYLFHLTPVFFILASVGMIGAYSHLKHIYQKAIFALAIPALFFTFGGGVLLPQTHYFLESDNPETLPVIFRERPYYAYTPQPDWQSAYDYIEKNRNHGDIIISSHPHFNKIYLEKSGYWIKYNYLGIKKEPSRIQNDREYYVNAKVIDNLEELQSIIRTNHGHIIFDYQAKDGRISAEIITFIEKNFPLVYHKKTNAFSEVWVYAF